jgi:hypothetical protein
MPADNLPDWIATWRPDARWKNVRQLSSMEWRLLVAETEMRAWNRAFKEYVRGERVSPPESECGQCRFADWLRCASDEVASQLPAIQRVERIHREAHETARKTVDLKRAGRHREAFASMQTTLILRENMRDQLGGLMLGGPVADLSAGA